MTAYAAPEKECDVIMKGGITSGIVYPKAVLALAEGHRFRNIGGTSAGAIAAAITAAAEYGRAAGGFERVAGIPIEMRDNLATLFQPGDGAGGLFRLFRAAVADGRPFRGLFGALLSVWPATLIGFVVGAVVGHSDGAMLSILRSLVIGLLFALIVGLAVFVARSLATLRKHDYGLCPGRTQAGQARPGFSDWVADMIEIAAGRMVAGGERPKAPLTFRDLWQGPDKTGSEALPAVNLRMMTTNLSMRRPAVLPNIGDRNYYFLPAEFRKILPDWIVDSMTPEAKRYGTTAYFCFPLPGDLPVAVATRMSLSFPFLISAVPVHRVDYPGRDDTMTRLLFSDGGITSNFPVHFFDALLPRRPTFGISLDDEDRNHPARRVYLPMEAGSGQWVPIEAIGGLVDFFFAVIYSAKDWQDQIQSTLAGYRERIVHVLLKPAEGGFNLAMPPEQIDTLIELGGRAGDLLVGRVGDPADKAPFDLEDHKWRRYLVAFARLEETLGKTSEVWRKEGFADFIKRYMIAPRSYGNSELAWRADVFARFDGLMDCVADWHENPLRSPNDDRFPRPETDIRITPKP